MEKSYRDLFDDLSAQVVKGQRIGELLEAIEHVDDMDPLRIPAVRAMQRKPTPPINLRYAREGGALILYARNTVRKRKAQRPTICAQIPAFEWLFDGAALAPMTDAVLRGQCVELVRRSFGYLETRIAVYFQIGYDSGLIVCEDSPQPVLVIEDREPPEVSA